MREYPPCDKRIDASEIERNMRGVREREVRKVCKKLYDECIVKLERVLYVVKEMRDGLCLEKDDDNVE